jgi:coenzyme F420-reducing hydrogenase delta subunit
MPGECHYLEGNLRARQRVEYVQRLLEEIGLNGRRIQMINLSAAMAGQFAYAIAEMTAEIQGIGPNALGKR